MRTTPTNLGLCLAGGGNRAFWQIGMLEVLGPEILPRVRAISGASAGSAAAVFFAAGVGDRARDVFAELRADIETNFDVRQLARRQPPMPHQRVYREVLARGIGDAGFSRIRELPFPIRILAAEPPPRLRVPLGLFAGLAAYQIEKIARPNALHPTVAPRLGFRAHVHDARDCESLDALIALVLASSSTPPITRLGSYGGANLIDGSLIDNAPAFAADEVEGVEKTLVLLTRAYPSHAVGRRGNRLYVPPSELPPAERWDYRRVAPIDETIELGHRDAARHRESILRFLDEPVGTRRSA